MPSLNFVQESEKESNIASQTDHSEMYKTYSSIGSERLLSLENEDTTLNKNGPNAQAQIFNVEDELMQKIKN